MEEASSESSSNLAESMLSRAAAGALAAMTRTMVRSLFRPRARQMPRDSRGNATRRSSMVIQELAPFRAARKSAWLSWEPTTTIGSGVFRAERYVAGVMMISGRVISSRYRARASTMLMTPGFSSRGRSFSWVLSPVMA